ncbi:MAG TPA: sugar phosphate isomerase/epimerase family protein, partial [Nitrososphaeraceae archaeon]|nr:sugar phosphate isomerase/epimerase family protein [Nitrososphaeraceae archaeon]
MKLAFSTNAFKKYSLNESIKMIRKIGYEGVEILCDIPHAYPPYLKEEDIVSVEESISKNGLEVSNLNAFTLYAITDVYHPSWIERDGQLRRLRVEHTNNCLNLARRIGAKNISTEPGGPIKTHDNKNINFDSKRSSSNNNNNNNSSNNAIDCHDLQAMDDLFIEGISRCAEIAKIYGVKVLVEPEPGLLIENSEQFLTFVKKINSDWVGLNFDMGHFFCVREDPADLIYRLARYIGHFHL